MSYNIRDIFEYIIALIDEFAKKYHLTEPQAFNYINNYKGIHFIEKNYGIIHTLDFKEAVESVANYCRRKGGEL